jgi:hypothetical protein
MFDPVCVKCSKPILATETKVTVEQVDACTMVAARVPYHAACRDQEAGEEDSRSPGEHARRHHPR